MCFNTMPGIFTNNYNCLKIELKICVNYFNTGTMYNGTRNKRKKHSKAYRKIRRSPFPMTSCKNLKMRPTNFGMPSMIYTKIGFLKTVIGSSPSSQS